MVNFVSSSDSEDSGSSRKRSSDEIVDTKNSAATVSDPEALIDRNATTDQLAKKDQPLEQSAVDFEKHLEQKLKNENDRAEQALQLRKNFFWIAVALVIATMAVSCFISVWIVVTMKEINTPVIVSFISGLAVESLGLMFIIARYLYPNGNKS